MIRKHLICLLFAAALSACFSQTSKKTVIFYGAQSQSSDTATVKMTQDLFFSQLGVMNQYYLEDKRTDFFNARLFTVSPASSAVHVYSEINESGSGWVCALHAVDGATGVSKTQKREYETLYKLLMEAKILVSIVLDELNAASESYKTAAAAADISSKSLENISEKTAALSIEQLSGTWKGEQYIDKILILRSGRGFVFFKNGATMNITVKITESGVQAVQTSSPNASFFPDMPRDAALQAAPTAPPVQWFLTPTAADVLAGEKRTIQAVTENGGILKTEQMSVAVQWNKQ